MCAAPGSKTAQIIELLNQGDNIQIPGKLLCCFCVLFPKDFVYFRGTVHCKRQRQQKMLYACSSDE